MKKEFKSLLPTAIALMIVFGIAVHDTKLDSLTKMALAIPLFVITYEGANMIALAGLAGDAHTHVEKASFERTASKATSWMPKVGTRQNEDKKYRSNKSKQRNQPPFDDYGLPALA